MDCNKHTACLLAPLLHDLRKNSDDNHEENNRLEWYETHQRFLDQDDSFDSIDGNALHFMRR